MLLLQVNAQKKVSNKVTDNLIVTTLITNVKIMDGSGKPAIKGSVRIKGDVIVEVGNLSANSNDQMIDGKGLVLAPGFIDAHSHHFGDLQKK